MTELVSVRKEDSRPVMLAPPASATFAVSAELCPQILCRLLGLIAQQSRLVERVEAHKEPNGLKVRLIVAGMDEHQAEIVAEKMRSLVSVRSVWLSWVGSPALAPAAPVGAEVRAYAPQPRALLVGRAA